MEQKENVWINLLNDLISNPFYYLPIAVSCIVLIILPISLLQAIRLYSLALCIRPFLSLFLIVYSVVILCHFLTNKFTKWKKKKDVHCRLSNNLNTPQKYMILSIWFLPQKSIPRDQTDFNVSELESHEIIKKSNAKSKNSYYSYGLTDITVEFLKQNPIIIQQWEDECKEGGFYVPKNENRD